jgi:hypothetical protein
LYCLSLLLLLLLLLLLQVTVSATLNIPSWFKDSQSFA